MGRDQRAAGSRRFGEMSPKPGVESPKTGDDSVFLSGRESESIIGWGPHIIKPEPPGLLNHKVDQAVGLMNQGTKPSLEKQVAVLADPVLTVLQLEGWKEGFIDE